MAKYEARLYGLASSSCWRKPGRRRRSQRRKRKITKRREDNEAKDIGRPERETIDRCRCNCNFSSRARLGSRAFSAAGKRFCRMANERQHAAPFSRILRCCDLGGTLSERWHPLDGGSSLASRACQLANLFCRRNVFLVFSKEVGRPRIYRLEAMKNTVLIVLELGQRGTVSLENERGRKELPASPAVSMPASKFVPGARWRNAGKGENSRIENVFLATRENGG